MVFQVMTGNQLQLWRSDGTTDGTTLLHEFTRADATSNWAPDLLASAGVVGNTLYFIDSEKPSFASGNTVTYHDLWKTDGTSAGTTLVVPNFAYSPDRFIDLTGGASFLASTPATTGLYRLDSSPGGASFVATMPSIPPSPVGQTVVSDGDLYVLGVTGGSGPWKYALYRSDGTALGTRQVIDLSNTPWPVVYSMSALTAADGMLYFFSFKAGGTELWQSDGTAAGTIPRSRHLARLAGIERFEHA